jgi:GNAT superfamily N-acetyltransferase
MARVHVDTWRTTYLGIVPDEHLAGLSYYHAEARWVSYLSDPKAEAHAFVVEAESGQIVGLASCGPLQEALAGYAGGEMYVLYVLQAFQGIGYGRLLVTQVTHDLADRGYRSMVVWVLKDNPACRFYERLGGHLTAEMTVQIGGKPLIDVAYSWPDLAVFEQDR